MTISFPAAFLVLSGGEGRRLGGADKASLLIGGERLVDRAIAAARGEPMVLIGPDIPVPDSVVITRESPQGGGPAAGVAAGVQELTDRYGRELGEISLIGILAVDQAGVTARTWRRLAEAAASADSTGAALVDAGRRQYGVAVVRWDALRRAIAARESWHGQSLRRLLDPLIGGEVPAEGPEARDVDTLADVTWWQEHGTGSGEGINDDGTG